MTWILGISAFYHDSTIALVQDGEIAFAASEERFSRRKHDADFPARALEAGLQHCGIRIADLDYVGFYEKPLLKFDRLLETYLAFAPRGYASFAKALPGWLQTKLHCRREIRQQLQRLGGGYSKQIVFCEHHESHAASAFFPSPFDEAAVLTMDGVGEWATTCWGVGRGQRLELQQEVHFPHSLGLLYSALTYFCGFRVNSGEYKLMGLAPYGQPKYFDLFCEHLLTLYRDGSYRLNMDYFGYCHSLQMTTAKLERLIGQPRREPEGELRRIDMDLAASIQLATEEVVLRAARHVHQQTGLDALCMAGGVALNCVANARLLREGPFKRLWVQPAAGDAGGALGVALLIWHQLLNRTRPLNPNDNQQGSLLGPHVDAKTEVDLLRKQGAVATRSASEPELMRRVAQELSDGKVVGWVQGRMEFGPRALGNRSILGDPRQAHMQSLMNHKIKQREAFRPFAPSILAERAGEFFQMPQTATQIDQIHGTEPLANAVADASPYMLFTYPVHPAKRCQPQDVTVAIQDRQVENPDGKKIDGDTMTAGDNGVEDIESWLTRLEQVRSVVPAVTHLDYSARVQTVDRGRFPRFHKLLCAFEELTGCPMLINTSFNIRGEPPVCNAAEAYRCFLATEIDVLVIEDYLFIKAEQPEFARLANRSHLLAPERD